MAVLRAKACRLLSIVLMGFTLAACDKCGNWFSTSASAYQSNPCKEEAPRQQ
jgi:hypothetical protein